MLRFVWQRYRASLAQQPLLTKASTSCVLMAASDASCQTAERQFQRQLLNKQDKNNKQQDSNANKNSNPISINLQKGCPANVDCPYNANNAAEQERFLRQHDWERTAHLGITGALYSGPLSHAWYQLLEQMMRRVPSFLVPYGGIALRMLLDAFLFSPVAVAGYFTVRSILEGKSWPALRHKLQNKWSAAVVASWSFWPVANLISFGVVPLELRVLWGNFMGLFWSAYLNFVNNARLEQVVEQRQRHDQQQPQQDFAATPEGRAAHGLICVCSHCRALRA